MKHLYLVPLFALLAHPPGAAEPLSPEAFDAYTRGKTLYYGQQGLSYGAERYLPGRRVIWTFLDGECNEGEWYVDNGDICFVYENIDRPQCWQFSLGPRGLVAEYRNDMTTLELYEAQDTGEEMLCLGPRIGV